MKLRYFSDADRLYIDLCESATPRSTGEQTFGGGVRLSFDEAGQVVGIDIRDASEKVNMGNLEVIGLPMGAATAH